MKYLVLTVVFATAPNLVMADAIERACNGSDRSAANPRLCSCIQQAADLTLSRREQNRAAKFFRDPHEAQVVRQSDRAQDEAFWQSYRSFGETAEAFCGGA